MHRHFANDASNKTVICHERKQGADPAVLPKNPHAQLGPLESINLENWD